jgi:hypothetical protein
MKIENISIWVTYTDDDGDEKSVVKRAKTFETAQENVGKLERFFENG